MIGGYLKNRWFGLKSIGNDRSWLALPLILLLMTGLVAFYSRILVWGLPPEFIWLFLKLRKARHRKSSCLFTLSSFSDLFNIFQVSSSRLLSFACWALSRLSLLVLRLSCVGVWQLPVFQHYACIVARAVLLTPLVVKTPSVSSPSQQ